MTDDEKKALAKKEEGALAPTDLSQEEMLALAERRMKLLDKVLTMAISSTNPRDWVSQEGEPYLMATGSEKIARRFGIKIVGLEKEKEIIDDKGNYKYTFVAEFKLATENDSIMAIGSCTSRDKFFSRSHGSTKPLDQINIHDIEMKAYSNMLNNGVKRLLGLRNLSWQQLKDADLDITKIEGVQYGTGKKKEDKKNSTSQEKPAIKNPNAPASEKQLKTITETILKSHLMHPAEKFALADQIKKGINMQIASDIIGFWIGEDRKNKASGERGRREMLERKSKETLASYLSTQEQIIEKKKPDIYKAYKEASDG